MHTNSHKINIIIVSFILSQVQPTMRLSSILIIWLSMNHSLVIVQATVLIKITFLVKTAIKFIISITITPLNISIQTITILISAKVCLLSSTKLSMSQWTSIWICILKSWTLIWVLTHSKTITKVQTYLSIRQILTSASNSSGKRQRIKKTIQKYRWIQT